ncbi:MAG TPA: hypothetical protein ENI48_11500 [Thioploca sp.]|nr:hypothetical protein [Thioploca sp.]
MNSEPAKKRITKSDLNQLAKSLYGEEASCEHVRSGNRGWYLHKGAEKTFIGANATEAFKYLQSQESVTETPASAASATPSTEAAAPVTSATEAVTPVTPVAETVASATPSVATAALVTAEDDPDRLPVPPEEVLEILLDKFPKTFFRDPEKIRPIQKYIHKKIRRLLDYKYTKNEISVALALYTQTTEYCQKLVLGGQRTDLEGNPCGEVSKQHQEDAKVRLAGEKPMRPAKKKIPKTPSPQLPPPALDQLVFGKMDMSVKINELPADSKTLRNGWEEFLIKTERHLVKIVVRPRTWKKLQKAAKEYPLWVANIRGKMGPRMKDGFELLTPTIQIFEKKPKEPVISDQ